MILTFKVLTREDLLAGHKDVEKPDLHHFNYPIFKAWIVDCILFIDENNIIELKNRHERITEINE